MITHLLSTSNSSARLLLRAQIQALTKGEIAPFQIADYCHVHIKTVQFWVQRFSNSASLKDRDQKTRGVNKTFSNEITLKVIAFFCQYENLPGYARWTLSSALHWFNKNPDYLGKDVKPSLSTLQRMLASHALKPHRYKYFLHISDPLFFEKMEPIIQLYLNPPSNLYCFDECTGIQALEKAAPSTKSVPGKIQQHEVEYIRHGTVSIFSVLTVASGQVFTKCIPDHTSITLIGALKEHILSTKTKHPQHYICDNYSSHSTPEFCQIIADLCGKELPENLKTVEQRKQWLSHTDKHIIFHFLPCHGSWLNLIENWFGILKKNSLTDVSMNSTAHLEQHILDYNDSWNESFAHPYQWNYDGKNLRGKTVRKLTAWLFCETQMSFSFLSKQMQLMYNIASESWELVSFNDWQALYNKLNDKVDYVKSIIANIDEEHFSNTKANTEEERRIKIDKKVASAKNNLHKNLESLLHILEVSLQAY